MNYAVITVAGKSERFNDGRENAVLKSIYYENRYEDTLLYHLIKKIERWTDCIILVGGFQYENLLQYAGKCLPVQNGKILFVYNQQYETLQSGNSLYLGLQRIFAEANAKQILFIEGDLDIDSESLDKVLSSEKSVLTVSRDAIYANKSVVLYQDAAGCYRYTFNQEHGLLQISEPFSAIFQSGQVWKFTNVKLLEECCRSFAKTDMTGTNLKIIQTYIDYSGIADMERVTFQWWLNCNTRTDYHKAVKHWRAGDKGRWTFYQTV